MYQPQDLTITPRVQRRLQDVWTYIETLQIERVGYGKCGDAHTTAMSFARAVQTLFSATEIWVDGPEGLSFGGVMPGGIQFGMIARHGEPEKVYVDGEQVSRFKHGPIKWTFHS